MSTIRDKLKQISSLRKLTENQPQFVAPAAEESSHSSNHEIEEIEIEEEVPVVSAKTGESSPPAEKVTTTPEASVPSESNKNDSVPVVVEEPVVAAPGAGDSKLSAGEEDVASQYRKMLKMGMPIGAVEQKMSVDGVDKNIIDIIVASEATEEAKAENETPSVIPPIAAQPDTPVVEASQGTAGTESIDETKTAEEEKNIEINVLPIAPATGAATLAGIGTNDGSSEQEIIVDDEGVEVAENTRNEEGTGAVGVPIGTEARAPDIVATVGDVESGTQTDAGQSKRISPSKRAGKERRRKVLQCFVALICLIALGAGLPFFIPFVEDNDTFTTVQRTGGTPTDTPVSPGPTASSAPTLTASPTAATEEPTISPSEATAAPQTALPSQAPVTQVPTETQVETAIPTSIPTPSPTPIPTPFPTPIPTGRPVTASPSAAPITPSPTIMPATPAPTTAPTAAPVSPGPTAFPTTPAPTENPTLAPATPAPSLAPVTPVPTEMPFTPSPTSVPTVMPVTPAPTDAPITLAPTIMPVTPAPTDNPTAIPLVTAPPTPAPSNVPLSPFLEQLEAISGEGTFEDTSSPQYQALQFLVAEGFGNDEVDTGVLERYAALVFYYATGGDSGWYQCFRGHLNCGGSQWLDGDVCSWQYISCNGNGFVTSLNFATDNGLTGSIPSEVWAFEFLEEFVLVGSRMGGSLPGKFGETASSIQVFRVENNEFSGTIASGFLRNSPVESLILAGNELRGSIPETFYDLTDLLQLYLNDNSGLTGRLSPSINNLADLIELRVSNTQIGGLIPNEIFELSALEEIDLRGSQFRGPISSAFVSLSDTINRLYLDNNQFAGTVPGNFGLLTNLQELTLHENMITGSISPTICTLRTGDLRVLTTDCDEVSCSCCSTCF